MSCQPGKPRRQSRAFNPEELFEVLDMVPRPPAEVDWQEAIWVASLILVQAIEDLLEPRQSLAAPSGMVGSHRRQWQRMARSRAKKVEMNRRDAEEFLFSEWFEELCDLLGYEPDVVRDRVFEREEPR